jgi:hypothetical protein
MAWAWHDLVCMIFVQQRCCKFERGEMHLFDMVHKVGEARCVHIGLKLKGMCDTCIEVACMSKVMMAKVVSSH